MAVLAVGMSACGQGGPEPPRAAASSSPSPTVTRAPDPRLRITAPEEGAAVDMRVEVAGRARPGTTVLLDGGCSAPGCQAIARAGEDGGWEGRLRLAPGEARIEAATTAGGARDSVTVRVRAPARATVAPPRPEPEVEVTAAPAPERVVVVGDSLAVGIRPLLPGLLPGADVSVDARTGRPLADGMAIIAGMDLRSQPTALAVSLFTNDDPRNVDALEAAVRATVDAVGPQGCAVWATIVRPPYGGVSYDAANARLVALDAELDDLVVVPWAEQVAASPDLLAPDGVHGTPPGYQARAAMYAEAIASC